ncbi:hypothetical protein QBC39DRAFT_48725 [Podospora conica]|nr:hypothetical protein QBC39DRAFT_48725 [Schizothecium conicum]
MTRPCGEDSAHSEATARTIHSGKRRPIRERDTETTDSSPATLRRATLAIYTSPQPRETPYSILLSRNLAATSRFVSCSRGISQRCPGPSWRPEATVSRKGDKEEDDDDGLSPRDRTARAMLVTYTSSPQPCETPYSILFPSLPAYGGFCLLPYTQTTLPLPSLRVSVASRSLVALFVWLMGFSATKVLKRPPLAWVSNDMVLTGVDGLGLG